MHVVPKQSKDETNKPNHIDFPQSPCPQMRITTDFNVRVGETDQRKQSKDEVRNCTHDVCTLSEPITCHLHYASVSMTIGSLVFFGIP